MIVKNKQSSEQLISQGLLCPYCLNLTEYVDSSIIYGKSYGMIYLCKRCDAWVGVHRGTSKALGRLANKTLRFWKKETHKYFDNIWMRKKCAGARVQGYKWLASQLGINSDQCHIGMFDINLCKKAIEACKPYYKETNIKVMKEL